MVKHPGESKVAPISEGMRRGAITGSRRECGSFRRRPQTGAGVIEKKLAQGPEETEVEE